MKFLNCTCSHLLYGQFLLGDGNFHLVWHRNHAGTGKDAVAVLMRIGVNDQEWGILGPKEHL